MFYDGALSSRTRTTARYRWYFTFNSAECEKPGKIEGIVQAPPRGYKHYQHNHFEGFCNQIPEGQVRVGLERKEYRRGLTVLDIMSRIVLKCHLLKLNINISRRKIAISRLKIQTTASSN